MFKSVFDLLIDPLGLPIEWYYEYIILAIINVVTYKIAFNKVGDMYRGGFIDGRMSGSFFHWLIRLLIFIVLWTLTYGVIWLGKAVLVNRKIVLVFLVSIICISIILIVFLKRRKQR